MKKVLYTSKNTNMLLYDADTDKPFGRLDTAHLRELSGKVVIVAAADEAGRWVVVNWSKWITATHSNPTECTALPVGESTGSAVWCVLGRCET